MFIKAPFCGTSSVLRISEKPSFSRHAGDAQSAVDTRLQAQETYADEARGKKAFPQKYDFCAAKRTGRKTC
jgi:hypothetical protein